MIEIYARLVLTRLNPSEDEMTNRMKRTNRINQLRSAEIEKAEDKVDPEGGMEMLDLMFVAVVIVFFALSFWYVRFCERV